MTSSIAKKVKGLAQNALGKTAKHENNNNDWQKQLAIILNQQRGVLNFAEYTVSEEHEKRMEQFAKELPQVFDNPSITPRSKWFDHPNYRRNSQMPPFHVHFRQEMQSVLGYLEKAHQIVINDNNNNNNNNNNPAHPHCKSALWQFQGCMGGLRGHVSIEEYAWFPVYQNLHSCVNLKFLKQDHQHLHQSESTVTQALQELLNATSSSAANGNDDDALKEQLVATIQLVMDFDQQLMGHLGEEEEIVVPITLAHQGRLPL